MRKIIIAVLINVINAFPSLGQQTQQLTYNQGISLYDIIVDANDTIWTGSDNGLVKIYNINSVIYNSSNSGTILNDCFALSLDSTGRIWAGGSNGISIFNKISWINYNTSNSPIPSNKINAICQAQNGCWIGTDSGITFFDGNNWITYDSINGGLICNNVTSVAVNGTTIMIATPLGISIFENSIWTNFPLNQFGISNVPVNKVVFTAGKFWINDKSNVKYFKNGTFESIDLREYDRAKGINGICAGNNNRLYAFNSNGLYKLYEIDEKLKIRYTNISVFPLLATLQTVPYQNQNHMAFADYKFILVTSSQFRKGYYSVNLDSSSFKLQQYLNGSPNDFLEINNVHTALLRQGDMHWDPYGQVPYYEVPVGSNKSPVYASAFWLAGVDQGGLLHTSAMTYRQQNSFDFWTGPLDTINGVADSATSSYYDRFWKIDYDMIQSFQINYLNGNLQNGSYTLPEAIATWPGHGTGNYSRKLAPFIDVNNDGVYNPYDGDYPELTGHQMLWWVYNDTLAPFVHTETGGKAFQYEIHGKAYGFNCNLNSPVDEVMNNTTFYQYEIINRSQNTYNNVHIGLWTDFDLGNAADDYVGCDTMLNTYFCYNGDNDDDGGAGYGLNPPMMNVTILKGPLANLNDSRDNNHNGLVDEQYETTGLNHFKYYENLNNITNGNPQFPQDFYNYLQNTDNSGQPYIDGSGSPSDFMYAGLPYTNSQTMPNLGIIPNDMRAIGSTGPFSLSPGATQTIDFAYIYTRDSLNPNGLTTSVARNTSDVQKIINGFNSGNYPCLTNVGLPSIKTPDVFTIYPNPANSSIRFNSEILGARYQIYCITGQLVQSGVFNGNPISVDALQPQLYIIKAQKSDKHFVQRMVKL